MQYHYTTWPDFGVPQNPLAFLKFLRDIRQSGAFKSDVGPPIVHCSAGIGRSGTFCLVDSCLVLVIKLILIHRVFFFFFFLPGVNFFINDQASCFYVYNALVCNCSYKIEFKFIVS